MPAPATGTSTKERIKMPKLTTRTIGFTLAAMTTVLSCAVLRPGLVGQDALRNSAVEMKVVGRSDDTFKKTVVFGPFHTGAFSTGSVKVNNDRPQHGLIVDDIMRYTTATQEFHFTQCDSAGDSIAVQCIATRKAKAAQYSSLMADESSSDQYEIQLSKNGEKVFLTYKKWTPLAVSFSKDSITMTDEYKPDKKEKMVFQGILFTRSGETVAAVSLMNEGLVWIKKDLDNGCKLLIAAISTAMLVQPNLENASPR
jgi:hypothetical protein